MNILSATYSEKKGSLLNHYHNYHQIMYIVSGQAEITVDNRTYTANSNSLVILSRFENHSIKVLSGEYKRYVVEVSSKLFAPVLVNRPESFSNVVCAEKHSEEIVKIFESIVKECENKESLYEKILEADLEKLFVYIERLQSVSVCADKSMEIIYSIQKAFERSYREKFSLEELSKEYHISRYHLSRLFKKTTGYSPIEYLIECRMSVAKRYLTTTDFSVQEIVDKCGFGDESNFCRKFREKNGQTPMEFRKRYK